LNFSKIELNIIVEEVMKARFLFLIKSVLLIAGIALLSTCAFKGEVYVAFSWSTANDQPNPATSDFSAIPNVPADLNDLASDNYFITLPGTYTIDYVAVGGGSFLNQSIKLEAVTTVGGFEDTYYTIFLSNTTGVTVDIIP
jgi:hypothetical protein